MKCTTIWHITQCSKLKDNRRFGGTYRFSLLDQKISRIRCRVKAGGKQLTATKVGCAGFIILNYLEKIYFPCGMSCSRHPRNYNECSLLLLSTDTRREARRIRRAPTETPSIVVVTSCSWRPGDCEAPKRAVCSMFFLSSVRFVIVTRSGVAGVGASH
jgi:hypothetical protein